MFFGILLIIVGIFMLYVIFDFFSIGNINKFGQRWVEKTIWLWLPIYALPRLIKEVILKK